MRKFLPFLIALLAFISVFSVAAPKAHAAYVGSELIDDPVFLNSGSMSPAQIQAFLTTKGGYIAGYSATETLSYYPNYNKTVSAAQLIYDAAQVYGVNPQVILATMQKEESLVTDPSPSASQIQFAMGYGCPDSGGCGSGAAGFFYQIDNGTWDLRFLMERARGNNSYWNTAISYPCRGNTQYYKPGLFPGNNVTFYDDHGTGYTSFVIANASTASLYCYTPHAYPGSSKEFFSGSYNFVAAFESWFGPTGATLLLKGSGPTVYLVYNNTRYAVPSGDVLAAYGLSNSRVTPTSDSYISSLTDGGLLTDLFTIQGDPTTYLADNGNRYGISSSTVCTNWAVNCSVNVASIPPQLAALFPSNGLLEPLMSYQGNYYLLNNGVKQLFLSSTAVTEHGYSTSAVTPIAEGINASQPAGVSYPQNNSLVKFASSPAFYFYSGSNFYAINSFDSYISWFSANDPIFGDSVSTYNQTPPATAGSLPTLFTYGGKKYLVDEYHKYDLSAVASNWPSAADATPLSYLIDRLPTVTVTSANSWYIPSGAIFTAQSSQTRTFSSWTDFIALGYTPQNVIPLLTSSVSSLSVGPNLVGPGATIKQTSSPLIVAVGSGSTAYNLTSMADFTGFRLNPARTLAVNAQTFNFYTSTTQNLQYLAQDSHSNNYIIIPDGTRLPASAAVLSAWGLTSSDFTSTDDSILSPLPLSTLTPTFAYDNGAIYYGSGGQKHLITNFSTYIAMGGNKNNTFSPSQAFIDDAPSGSND